MDKKSLITIGAFAGGLIVGSVTTFLVARKAIQDKYEKIANEEIDEVKQHYRLLSKEDYKTPGDLVRESMQEFSDDVKEILNGYSGDDDDDTDPESFEAKMKQLSEAELRNIFDRAVEIPEGVEEVDPPMWSLADRRAAGGPYLLTTEEFMEDFQNYEKITLTYFEGDDTLVDEQNKRIDDHSFLGEDNLHKFGQLAGESHVLYVRNDDNEADFEVILDTSSYAKEILGVDDDYDEKPKKRTPRMRDDE